MSFVAMPVGQRFFRFVDQRRSIGGELFFGYLFHFQSLHDFGLRRLLIS